MKRIASLALSLVMAVVFAQSAISATLVNDTFDAPISPEWVTDRYTPDTFTTVDFDGDSRLLLSISVEDSAANRPPGQSGLFYNTQGKKRPSVWSGDWTMEAEFHVSDDMFDTVSLRRTDLWARTGNIGTEAGAGYPIIGFVQDNPSAPLDPTAPLTPRYRVWDSDTPNGWVDLPNAVVPGWNTVSMAGNSTSVEFSLNGMLVYTDNTVLPLNKELTGTFIQAYNFGNGNYSVHWDNLKVVGVPEPSSALLAGIPVLGFLVHRSRRPALCA